MGLIFKDNHCNIESNSFYFGICQAYVDTYNANFTLSVDISGKVAFRKILHALTIEVVSNALPKTITSNYVAQIHISKYRTCSSRGLLDTTSMIQFDFTYFKLISKLLERKHFQSKSK